MPEEGLRAEDASPARPGHERRPNQQAPSPETPRGGGGGRGTGQGASAARGAAGVPVRVGAACSTHRGGPRTGESTEDSGATCRPETEMTRRRR